MRRNVSKLALSRETLRVLNDSDLSQVVAGRDGVLRVERDCFHVRRCETENNSCHPWDIVIDGDFRLERP
jgi:hypothetical protein